MDVNQLRCLVALAEEANFSRAAGRLGWHQQLRHGGWRGRFSDSLQRHERGDRWARWRGSAERRQRRPGRSLWSHAFDGLSLLGRRWSERHRGQQRAQAARTQAAHAAAAHQAAGCGGVGSPLPSSATKRKLSTNMKYSPQ